MALKRNIDELNSTRNQVFVTPVKRDDRDQRVSRHGYDDDSTSKPGFMDHKQNTVIRGGQTSNNIFRGQKGPLMNNQQFGAGGVSPHSYPIGQQNKAILGSMQNNRSRSQIITSENGYKNLGTPNINYNRNNTSNMQ